MHALRKRRANIAQARFSTAECGSGCLGQDIATGGTSVPRPAPQQDCLASWGNSDIFGYTTAP